MAEDVLGRFRGKPSAPEQASPATAIPPKVKEEYEAFKAVTRRKNVLKIRPYLRAWERIPYRHIHRILEDGPYGTDIAIIYHMAVVTIKGRNLHELPEALGEENCEFIQAFDPDAFEKPDPTRPYIDTITIHTQTREGMVKATDTLQSEIAKLNNTRN